MTKQPRGSWLWVSYFDTMLPPCYAFCLLHSTAHLTSYRQLWFWRAASAPYLLSYLINVVSLHNLWVPLDPYVGLESYQLISNCLAIVVHVLMSHCLIDHLQYWQPCDLKKPFRIMYTALEHLFPIQYIKYSNDRRIP